MADSAVVVATCTARYAFTGESEVELSYKKGDLIKILKKDPERNWWEGIDRDGKRGFFSKNYVIEVKEFTQPPLFRQNSLDKTNSNSKAPGSAPLSARFEHLKQQPQIVSSDPSIPTRKLSAGQTNGQNTSVATGSPAPFNRPPQPAAVGRISPRDLQPAASPAAPFGRGRGEPPPLSPSGRGMPISKPPPQGNQIPPQATPPQSPKLAEPSSTPQDPQQLPSPGRGSPKGPPQLGALFMAGRGAPAGPPQVGGGRGGSGRGTNPGGVSPRPIATSDGSGSSSARTPPVEPNGGSPRSIPRGPQSLQPPAQPQSLGGGATTSPRFVASENVSPRLPMGPPPGGRGLPPQGRGVGPMGGGRGVVAPPPGDAGRGFRTGIASSAPSSSHPPPHTPVEEDGPPPALPPREHEPPPPLPHRADEDDTLPPPTPPLPSVDYEDHVTPPPSPTDEDRLPPPPPPDDDMPPPPPPPDDDVTDPSPGIHMIPPHLPARDEEDNDNNNNTQRLPPPLPPALSIENLNFPPPPLPPTITTADPVDEPEPAPAILVPPRPRVSPRVGSGGHLQVKEPRRRSSTTPSPKLEANEEENKEPDDDDEEMPLPPDLDDLPPPNLDDLPPPMDQDFPPIMINDLPPPSLDDLPPPILDDLPSDLPPPMVDYRAKPRYITLSNKPAAGQDTSPSSSPPTADKKGRLARVMSFKNKGEKRPEMSRTVSAKLPPQGKKAK